MNSTESPHFKPDLRLIRQTIFSAARVRIAIDVVISLILIIIWWSLFKAILNFGGQEDWIFLDKLSTPVANFLRQYNDILWKCIALIMSLIMLCILVAVNKFTLNSFRNLYPNPRLMHHLLNTLSPHAKHMLDWIWQDRNEPISVRTLMRCYQSIQLGHYQTLCQIEEQTRLLKAPVVETQVAPRPTGSAHSDTPTLSAKDD